MAKMGYKPGQGIGAGGGGRVEPVEVDLKATRAGLGVDEAKKRQRDSSRAQQAERGVHAVSSEPCESRHRAASKQHYWVLAVVATGLLPEHGRGAVQVQNRLGFTRNPKQPSCRRRRRRTPRGRRKATLERPAR